MIRHSELGASRFERSRRLSELIRGHKIALGGNTSLRIYGQINCKSGKKMLVKNRVFFKSEQEAKGYGFRPCGSCMRKAYLFWKAEVDRLRHK